MPNMCYRPLVITGCFFANKGGPIIIVRNKFGVSIIGNFFTQQDNPGKGAAYNYSKEQFTGKETNWILLFKIRLNYSKSSEEQ